jgi:hypothetical protein
MWKMQLKRIFLFIDGRLIGEKLEDKKGLNYIPLIPLIFINHHQLVSSWDVQQIFFYKQKMYQWNEI